jgi:uncharacterized protein
MKSFSYFTVFNHYVIVLVVVLTSSSLMSQVSTPTASPRLITVTGSAEMSIEPDEVEVSITIYTERNNLEKHETELMTICKKNGIPDSLLTFKSSLGYNDWYHWYWWWHYRSSTTVYQTYKLKITSKTNFANFVKDLNKPWVQDVAVSATTNKDLQIYRKEVKKEAMRMAKEKASYLLEAIDEKLGSVISIDEVNSESDANYRYWGNNAVHASNSVISSSNVAANPELDGVSKIKLRYEVKAVFAIK